MPLIINIMELETIINRARSSEPPVDGVLGHDLSILAEVYGNMVYGKCRPLDVDQLPEKQRAVVARWSQSAPAGDVSSVQCPLRPGDPAIDGCEACQ